MFIYIMTEKDERIVEVDLRHSKAVGNKRRETSCFVHRGAG